MSLVMNFGGRDSGSINKYLVNGFVLAKLITENRAKEFTQFLQFLDTVSQYGVCWKYLNNPMS